MTTKSNLSKNKTIPFDPRFAKLGINISAALFLSQAINCQVDEDGWFTKRQSEWQDETGLTIYQQMYARTKLAEMGILEEKQKGMPRQIYYKVNFDNLQNQLCGSF